MVMNRRFRSLAAGLGLVGALASCGDSGTGPVDPVDPVFGAPLVVLSGLVDGRAPLDYSGRVVASARDGQVVDSVVVTVGGERFSSVGSSLDFSGVFDNRSSGAVTEAVVALAYPDKGSVGRASSSVGVLPEFVSDRFSVRLFPDAFFGVDGRAVTVPGSPLEASLEFSDGTVLRSDSSGFADFPVGHVFEPGDYVVTVRAVGRPRQELTVRLGYDGVVPVDVGLEDELFDLWSEFMHPLVPSSDVLPVDIDRFVHRWNRPIDEIMVAHWGVERHSDGSITSLSPGVVGDSVADVYAFRSHWLESVRHHAGVMPQYVPQCVVPVVYELESDSFPDVTNLVDQTTGRMFVIPQLGNRFGVIDQSNRYDVAPEDGVVRACFLLADATINNISQSGFSNDLHESIGMRHPRTADRGNNRDLQNLLLDNTFEFGYIPTGDPREALLKISRVHWNVPAGSGLRFRDGERTFYVNNSSDPVSNTSSHASWVSCDTGAVFSSFDVPYKY